MARIDALIDRMLAGELELGSSTGAEALLDLVYDPDDWCPELLAAQPGPIAEIQYWGHGRWGNALIAGQPLGEASLVAGGPHHGALRAVRARLAPGAPGYRRLLIEPRPLPSLDWASTKHETPYGTALVDWRRDGDHIRISAVVPANTTASVRLPDGRALDIEAGTFEWTVAADAAPEPTPVTSATSLAAVIDDPEAYQTVLAAFDRIDPAVTRDFRRRMAWVPNQPLFGAFSLISPAVVAEVEGSLADLNRRRGL